MPLMRRIDVGPLGGCQIRTCDRRGVSDLFGENRLRLVILFVQ